MYAGDRHPPTNIPGTVYWYKPRPAIRKRELGSMSICVYTPAVFLGQTFLVRMGFLRPLHLLSGTFLIFSGCFGSRLDSIRLIHPLKIKKRPKTKENRNLQTAGGVQAVLGVVQSAVL